MRKIVWGVLSTARIGTTKVLPGMQKSDQLEIRALASRNLATAQAEAAKLGIPVAYGSYEELLADPAIEAVYNPLPNHLHVPMTLAAARAGKHVLCEKPMALNADEAAQLREVAGQVHIMEAFMVRFHPQWIRARELVRSGRIGRLVGIQVWFSYFNNDPGNIRNQAGIGGGALYDIGCYPVVAGRWFFESEPLRVVSLADRDPAFGTDRLFSALLDFGAGRQLNFSVAMQTVPYQRIQLVGEHGRIEIVIPFNAPQGATTQIKLDDGRALDGAGINTQTVAESDQYQLQGEAFSAAVRGDAALPYGVEDAVQNMRIIDALYASERQGGWVSL